MSRGYFRVSPRSVNEKEIEPRPESGTNSRENQIALEDPRFRRRAINVASGRSPDEKAAASRTRRLALTIINLARRRSLGRSRDLLL